MAHENLNQQNHGGRDQGTQRDSTQPAQPKKGRGFASMDPAKQKEIASKGGRAAHEKGTAHQFSADEAREAGRKGGGTVSRDRHHMAEIGRVGGQARGRKHRATATAETAAAEKGDSAAPGGEEVAQERKGGEYHH
jgi:general stress protein YciG